MGSPHPLPTPSPPGRLCRCRTLIIEPMAEAAALPLGPRPGGALARGVMEDLQAAAGPRGRGEDPRGEGIWQLTLPKRPMVYFIPHHSGKLTPWVVVRRGEA